MISKEEIFSIQDPKEFEDVALKVFRYQAVNNLIYKEFLNHLNVSVGQINSVIEIPFLPIRFFKSHKVISENLKEEKIFTSSGTTGLQTSQHFVADLDLYHQSLEKGFESFYGDFEDYTIFALLPSYLEREGSSLIEMVRYWLSRSGKGGFFLDDFDDLHEKLIQNENEGKKAILIGVSFALLDFTEKFQMKLKNTIVMETGGMKGRKEEITREALHRKLRNGFGVGEIHSEYGMTELLSQAYSQRDLKFCCPNWMRILVRDAEDPLEVHSGNKSGGINVIDLANLNSCSFIATDDLGRLYADGSFEVLGRFDNSDVRGCNLMVGEV